MNTLEKRREALNVVRELVEKVERAVENSTALIEDAQKRHAELKEGARKLRAKFNELEAKIDRRSVVKIEQTVLAIVQDVWDNAEFWRSAL